MPDFSEYVEICKKCMEDEFVYQNFKAMPEYYNIVGMHSEKMANLYLENILLNLKNSEYTDKEKLLSESYIKRSCGKDLIGNPIVRWNNNGNECELTSIRYISTVSDLFSIFKDFDSINSICEIGGGNGGLASKLISFFKRNINYKIVDLPEVNDLIKKIHDDLEITYNSSMTIENEDYDLVISNYGFTECPRNDQEIYMENIIKNSKRGYMICNNEMGKDSDPFTGMNRKEIVDRIISYGKKVVVENERPEFNSYNNKLILWGQHYEK